MPELTKTKLADLEEDFRNYKSFPKKIIETLIADDWKPEDLNSWIRGSTGHTEKALNDMIKKEDNKSYTYYSKLYSDISRAYDNLTDELKHIVDEYLWGPSNYLGWIEIAQQIHCSTGSVYRKRYKILETLAKERGILAE
ncbi:RinA family phage transcriptional regulator [Enterococcus phoeniculicola]|uniref:RinA family phage transcriptional regulator n=1 Tax=Enterococcus phoeniculicola ATCC BAA-412 TaxID=1158610 RepID=R3TKS4_9ENTE|nr:RinA family phage transcriptional regulator [Enterococcus phoeniculicola]EOL42014.1 RinA family phage transcriptional regulator [Enterococcus phoeniculicola ATCC BAA-412]EOT79707.1 hypothetical protein I589_01219 [Enterococcus phoeniculicola ATCC BAA-412]OJG71770.1 RinA family phage transcriptional regulator [Enterococcus phoeniculicola]